MKGDVTTGFPVPTQEMIDRENLPKDFANLNFWVNSAALIPDTVYLDDGCPHEWLVL